MIKVLQANLQHSKAATAVLSTITVGGAVDFALIQEPWVRNNMIAGLGASGGLTIPGHHKNTRTGIWVRNGLKCAPVLEFCSRDLTTVKTMCKASGRPLLLASVYMP